MQAVFEVAVEWEPGRYRDQLVVFLMYDADVRAFEALPLVRRVRSSWGSIAYLFDSEAESIISMGRRRNSALGGSVGFCVRCLRSDVVHLRA